MNKYRSVHFKAALTSENGVRFTPEACELLGISPGDELLVLVRGGRVVMLPTPKNIPMAMRELCPELWQGTGEYLKEERDSW